MQLCVVPVVQIVNVPQVMVTPVISVIDKCSSSSAGSFILISKLVVVLKLCVFLLGLTIRVT